MAKLLATIIVTDARAQLRSSQLAPWLNNGPLAMCPIRLNSIQPRAFRRQLTNEYSHPTFLLCFLIVGSHPATHHLRDMPRGIIPYQQQCFLAVLDQSTTDPSEKFCSNDRYWPATHEPQLYLFGICSQHSVTANGFRLFILLIDPVFYQPQRFSLSPTMQPGLSKATPPDLIYIPQYPIRVLLGQADQSRTRLFLRP